MNCLTTDTNPLDFGNYKAQRLTVSAVELFNSLHDH
jgi:hypothetical protein